MTLTHHGPQAAVATYPDSMSSPTSEPGPACPQPELPTGSRYTQMAGTLSRVALQRLEESGWYSQLPPQERSWVGLVAQAGVRSFLTWLEDPTAQPLVTAQVFGTAPRELTRSVTLRQTLDLVRAVVAATEECTPSLAVDPADPEEVHEIRHAVLRYSREVAFSAAEVYAHAAELRGTWDSRLEALVVHTLIRGDPDESLHTRMDALGWKRHPALFVLVGANPDEQEAFTAGLSLRQQAMDIADDVMVGVSANRLIAVIGTSDSAHADTIGTRLAGACAPNKPVVIGPVVRSFAELPSSAQAAVCGFQTAGARRTCPRPVHAGDLLPERALSGDAQATAQLRRLYERLRAAGPVTADTVEAYLDTGGSLEGTAKQLYVHPNTVRYRLRKAAEELGWDATSPRDGYVLQLAATVGRATPESL